MPKAVAMVGISSSARPTGASGYVHDAIPELAGQVAGKLDDQACFPDPTGSGHGHEPDVRWSASASRSASSRVRPTNVVRGTGNEATGFVSPASVMLRCCLPMSNSGVRTQHEDRTIARQVRMDGSTRAREP